ncbi:MAG TPA: DUF4105 domain-containing protein [Candidatus Acidoferrales bacterium]|nr:DUF4105 domain-containing protein [Candidatus Acidoferrales bacterium]
MTIANPKPFWRRLVRATSLALAWLVVSLLALWCLAALFVDVRGWPGYPAAAVYSGLFVAILFAVKQPWLRLAGCLACSLAVLMWWLSLKPSSARNWQQDVSQTAWADVHSTNVVIHNVRNCEYRAELDYTCRWETRTYELSQLQGGDIYVVYWGSPWIAHTMVSFPFGNDDHIAFSVETRKTVGQDYSALLGFFRQYELIYIPSDERDVVRLRTNYRTGEDVYLYHLRWDAVRARARFLEYIDRINELHERPEWYNAITKNCTTSLFAQREATAGAVPTMSMWNWQVLANGKLDKFAYDNGAFAGDLPFERLKQRAYINPIARTVSGEDDPGFSRRIREGRPGFPSPPAGGAPGAAPQ